MPRPGRAYWKGFLRLSLVSIPVEVYTAVETAAAISLNQFHKPTGKRINYTKTVKGVGPVDTADIVKGYEVDKDVYVTLEDGEIESLKLESKRTLDLAQFIDVSEIDPRYFGDLPSLKLDKEMVALARELISKKAAPFEPSKFHDSYSEAMRALIVEKAKGKRIVAKPSPSEPQGKVVDLLDALRKSLKTSSSEAPKRARAPQKKAS